MLIRRAPEVRYSEVTPRAAYMSRRRLLAGATAGLLLTGTDLSAAKLSGAKSQFSTSEPQTPLKDITTYNNYYEFGTDKSDPARNSGQFKTQPWQVTVGGLCNKPGKYDLDSLMKVAPLEERIYRLRCVEAWSMVIPWIGFSLSHVLSKAEPQSKAKYVAFETYYDGKQMPMAERSGIPLPYREGLRMDEAMHPLTMLSFGLYGESLLPQNGAPVRLVVPWKYGFKSIKSIVKITFTDSEPKITWRMMNGREYGFYSNVNPDVDHPRWSQGSERRIGEFFKRKTLPFNGYADQVASLYRGMDLKANY
ncbi:MAG TPA: protein-methionine-sulfoxide reductase catalytic subunit MsrP [Bryobacteraceae bacterium]|nr:protein-methionine-sulfoxide reductase catalytic subunit MsrP [Bryobacteraceae bacterium]